MSLAGLMSGAECAVQVNPLSQVLKHTDGDRSLQQVRLLSPHGLIRLLTPLQFYQDRIAGPSSSRVRVPYSIGLSHSAELRSSFIIYPRLLTMRLPSTIWLWPVNSSKLRRPQLLGPLSLRHKWHRCRAFFLVKSHTCQPTAACQTLVMLGQRSSAPRVLRVYIKIPSHQLLGQASSTQ